MAILNYVGEKESERVLMQFLVHDREMTILVILEQKRSLRQNLYIAFLSWTIIIDINWGWGWGRTNIKIF